MGNTENLSNQDAINKIREIAKETNISMFCTGLSKRPFDSVPLATQEVDDEGNIWFLTSTKSDFFQNLETDKDTQVLYGNPGDMEFLSLYGKTDVSQDQGRIEKYWSPFVEAYFKRGKDDPTIRLLKFQPTQGYYWDTQHGKMVSFLKTMVSAATGAELSGGVSGTLSV